MNTHGKIPQTRFDWIDQTKGLAILAIVIFHFFQNYPEKMQLISILDRNGAKLGYAAVDIFFIMAGLNTSYPLILKLRKNQINPVKINWKSWLKKRLYRIYPAYLLAIISSCLFYVCFGDFKINSALNFALTFIGLAGMKFQAVNPGFWFFTVILEAYITTPLIFIFCKNQPYKILFLGCIGAIVTKITAFYFFLIQNKYIYLFLLQNNFLGSYVFQFCLGLYWGFIYAEYQTFRKIDFVVSTTIFAFSLILYGIFTVTKVDIIYMIGFDMLFTPFFFLGIYTFLIRLDKTLNFKRLLSFFSMLGIYSYQIYLIHQPLYFVLLPKLNNYLQINNYLKIVISLILVGTLLALYVFIFTKIERLITKKLETIMNQPS